MPAKKVCDECAAVCDKEKTVALLRRQRFLFGGLGRNRTTDTRVFNAPLQTRLPCTCVNVIFFYVFVFECTAYTVTLYKFTVIVLQLWNAVVSVLHVINIRF